MILKRFFVVISSVFFGCLASESAPMIDLIEDPIPIEDPIEVVEAIESIEADPIVESIPEENSESPIENPSPKAGHKNKKSPKPEVRSYRQYNQDIEEMDKDMDEIINDLRKQKRRK